MKKIIYILMVVCLIVVAFIYRPAKPTLLMEYDTREAIILPAKSPSESKQTTDIIINPSGQNLYHITKNITFDPVANQIKVPVISTIKQFIGLNDIVANGNPVEGQPTLTPYDLSVNSQANTDSKDFLTLIDEYYADSPISTSSEIENVRINVYKFTNNANEGNGERIVVTLPYKKDNLVIPYQNNSVEIDKNDSLVTYTSDEDVFYLLVEDNTSIDITIGSFTQEASQSTLYEALDSLLLEYINKFSEYEIKPYPLDQVSKDSRLNLLLKDIEKNFNNNYFDSLSDLFDNFISKYFIFEYTIPYENVSKLQYSISTRSNISHGRNVRRGIYIYNPNEDEISLNVLENNFLELLNRNLVESQINTINESINLEFNVK